MGWSWKRAGKAVLSGGMSELPKGKAKTVLDPFSAVDKTMDVGAKYRSKGQHKDIQKEIRQAYADNPMVSEGGNTTQNVDTFADPESGLTPNMQAGGPGSPSDQAAQDYIKQANDWTANSDKAFAPVFEQFQKSHGKVDEMLNLQKDAATNSQAEAARRGVEMGALQGASGFGGMQAGKNLQAQMFGQDLTNKAYQNALEQHLGLDKGEINARIGKTTNDLSEIQRLKEKATGTTYEGQMADQERALKMDALKLQTIGAMDLSGLSEEERKQIWADLGLSNP